MPNPVRNPEPEDPVNRIADAILNFISRIPDTAERKSRDPKKAAKQVANSAALKSAMTAGTLALPPGPLGWLTILPELVAVWKIQAQMIADIAALYGRKSSLTREQMLYCLFRHMAAQAVRDLVVRLGERFLVRRVSLQMLKKIAARIGMKVTQRAIGKGVSRWLPVVGALGVAGYAYCDSGQVASTTIEMFESGIEIGPESVDGIHEKQA